MGGRHGLKKQGYTKRQLVPMTPHALERVRTHWPAAGYLYDADIRFIISEQVLDALHEQRFILAPGGTYVPISIAGTDGFAVLMADIIRTVMPTAWCAEVASTLRKKTNEST